MERINPLSSINILLSLLNDFKFHLIIFPSLSPEYIYLLSVEIFIERTKLLFLAIKSGY